MEIATDSRIRAPRPSVCVRDLQIQVDGIHLLHSNLGCYGVVVAKVPVEVLIQLSFARGLLSADLSLKYISKSRSAVP